VIRLSKLADYAIVLLGHIATRPVGDVCTARQLSEASMLPLPTASKVLKSLARAQLLAAQRGKRGGYTLSRTPEQIDVASIIIAVDGPISLTECTVSSLNKCDIAPICPVRSGWKHISQKVSEALETLTLKDMIEPASMQRATQQHERPLKIVRQ